MGDMADIWRDIKAYWRVKRNKNLKEAKATILNGVLFTKHTEYHYSLRYPLQGERLDYWPSRNKWRWKNRNYTGTPHDLQQFVSKRAP